MEKGIPIFGSDEDGEERKKTKDLRPVSCGQKCFWVEMYKFKADGMHWPNTERNGKGCPVRNHENN